MAHRVEFLVIAAEFTRAVTTGCDLGSQREHQHTDGGQPHKDTPAGKRGGEDGHQSWLPLDLTPSNTGTFLTSKPRQRFHWG